jgi:hypothetical protein
MSLQSYAPLMDEPRWPHALPIPRPLNDNALISIEPGIESEPHGSPWILIGAIAGVVATVAAVGLLGWLAFRLAAGLLG